MEGISRRAIVAGALGIVGAGIAGCAVMRPTSTQPSVTGSTASPSQSPGPTAQPSPVDTRPRAPLTGLLVKNAASLAHVAVSVKVPNAQREYPHRGLNDADIVFCQPNGPAYTRFNAVFHSRFPDGVNPVRSIRPVDVPLLSPMKPAFGNTGAMDWVVKYVEHYAQFIENMSYMDFRGTNAYGIDPRRVYTLGGRRYFDKAVVAHPKVLASLARRMTAPPQRYLPFAPDAAGASTAAGRSAKTVAIPYGPAATHDMSYTYDAATKRYLRHEPWGPHVLIDGARVSADNVLVIRARWSMKKIFPGGGGADPVVEIINETGNFHYFHGGRYVTGTWRKGPVNSLFEFTTADNAPLQIAPGRTWIELPQADAKLRIGR